jgi:hypothetical protein
MGSAPDTTLGPHVFGANYFFNNLQHEWPCSGFEKRTVWLKKGRNVRIVLQQGCPWGRIDGASRRFRIPLFHFLCSRQLDFLSLASSMTWALHMPGPHMLNFMARVWIPCGPTDMGFYLLWIAYFVCCV